MSNEWIWVLFALVNFSMLLIIYRIFGKPGLFVWIGMATVVANIQVLKTIELFGMTATLGNIIYGTIFLATDILNERYGKNEARKAVWMGFSTLIGMSIMMQIALTFTPASGDVAQKALSTLFGIVPQIAVGSLAAYIVSQYIDVWIYAMLKNRFNDHKWLWLRNNVSTMTSQLIDTAIFCSIAFYGVFPFHIWWEVFLTTYFIKFLVAAIDTPFLYAARKFPK
ncbi:queuosine precursor transporter [Thalassobacillus pellis]|uniref:queuosine precursor transporter n=1 Tax=Thalassobacillus pellis TaxID=748008 RepID=UPI001960216A|nr:queuosine precursor transporter [Thalassobacillus pellis]MBM7552521.1 putative integral membrane protein (TIGR00697 family) [Thalassobacillus pellis]